MSQEDCLSPKEEEQKSQFSNETTSSERLRSSNKFKKRRAMAGSDANSLRFKHGQTSLITVYIVHIKQVWHLTMEAVTHWKALPVHLVTRIAFDFAAHISLIALLRGTGLSFLLGFWASCPGPMWFHLTQTER